MVSGPDIITYIGVPLAVLGVLPIIFNTISILATLAKVRRMLRHGRLAGIARGDVFNHVIEIELPRYTIAPLHREEQRSKYWRLAEYQSHIPGGTWTTFNWRKHKTGSKTQRIDYSDQLRQPQAEIGFEELVSFLLDLGAVPDPAGFRMLRGSGLWVPTGTPLLLSPDRHEAVLTIAPLDDSDGKLSLAVRWSSKWGMRDPSSLPPYWVILRGALDGDIFLEKSTVKNVQEVTTAFKVEHSVEPTDESKYATTEIDIERASISKCMSFDIEHPSALKVNLATGQHTPMIRCHIGVFGLKTAIPHDINLVEPLPIDHIRCEETRVHSTGDWFASALTALSISSQTMLWNYKVPAAIFAFSQRDSIPCGVLVLLCIIDESATPE